VTTGTVLDDWADFVHQVRRDGLKGLPVSVLDSLRTSFYDTTAVTYSGAGQAAPKRLAEYVRSLGVPGRSAMILGEPTRPEFAALVNATAAHAEDYDDSATAIIGGHASAILVPVALAVAQHVGADGAAAMLAAVCGYEIAFAVGEVVNPFHYENGFHPTSTVGTIAAAATAGYLLDLTTSEQANALALACSMSSGLKGNFASMAKPMHCGWAAKAGISAALFASHGVTGNVAVFDGRQGFASVYGGPNARPARRTLGQTWYLDDPGIGLRKAWACCASIHASVEASITIARSHEVDPDDIEQIVCEVPGRRIPHTDRPDAASPAAARFSHQYCVAASLTHGRLSPGHFSPHAINDPRVRRLMPLVKLVRATAMDDRDPDMRNGDDFAATVTVRVRDGRELQATVDAPLGTRNRPLSGEHLEEKFTACVAPALGAARSAELSDLVHGLQWASDVDGVLLNLEGAQSE
jgi:2-methylcitrate dehydratase PrpD